LLVKHSIVTFDDFLIRRQRPQLLRGIFGQFLLGSISHVTQRHIQYLYMAIACYCYWTPLPTSARV